MAKEYVKNCINENGQISQSVNDLCDELYDHMNNSNIELKEYTYLGTLKTMLKNYNIIYHSVMILAFLISQINLILVLKVGLNI